MTTDTQLQIAIAKMLSDKLTVYTNPTSNHTTIFWNGNDPRFVESVRPTEWENIVRLVEESLTFNEYENYFWQLDVICNPTPLSLGWPKRCMNICKATIEQRATAILKVKGDLK